MQRPNAKKSQPKKPPLSPLSSQAASSPSSSPYTLPVLALLFALAAFFVYFRQDKITSQHALLKTQDLTLDHLRQCALISTAAKDHHFPSLSWSEQNPQDVLAYVTPWNRQGLVVAEEYAHKLTYLAPVWYQLRQQQKQQLELTGKHEFNGTWLDNVRQNSGGRVRIVPRVIWEVPAFVSPDQVAEVVGLLVDEAKERNYDGCVPERWDGVERGASTFYFFPCLSSLEIEESSPILQKSYCHCRPSYPFSSHLLLPSLPPSCPPFRYTLEFPIDGRGVFTHLTSSLKAALSLALPPTPPPVLIVAIPAFQMPSRPGTQREIQVFIFIFYFVCVSQALPPFLPPSLPPSSTIPHLPTFSRATRPSFLPHDLQLIQHSLPPFLPPSLPPSIRQVTPSLLLSLAPHVHRFSLMTYDYGRTSSGAPISPLGWMEETVRSFVVEGGRKERVRLMKGKMLLGLPWYGYVGGQAMVGHEFESKVLERPEKVRRFEWEEESQELVFSLGGEGGREEEVGGTYPTPAFFWRRFELVEEMGMAGVAVWEVGQGLECFPMLW